MSRHKRYHRTLAGKYRNAKASAKRRGLTWDLSKKEFERLSKYNCFYCDGPLPETGHGLDRVDNNYGYVTWNAVPSCSLCNYTKQLAADEETWLVIVNALKNYHQKDD